MNRPKIKYHNIVTNEEIERDMNDEEYSQYLTDLAKHEEKQIELEEKITAKKLLLDRLGITEEEAQLLLGGN